eukprot:Blabericola_migrator_1__1351@NODE_1350_length_4748_cov_121_279855_g906_i0_p3_GENE_NODE_1350_length_4748_cov_121_279855_g906_i0NODE_1350_length_4748_cov_121_279855_g906_i0_p3_ORF_typecomplete_len181_score28_02HVSL/PF09749_9/3_6e152_5_RNA_ligase2/PF13563_6/5_4e022_5_RNA_ligase2/PF13563_6/3_2e06CPDase/PF07823_11/0_0027DUF459/PF04311_13/0_31_NODE_1350_length_4748_cov_121_279855_g906_i064606
MSNVFPSFLYVSVKDNDDLTKSLQDVATRLQSVAKFKLPNQATGLHVSLTPPFVISDFHVSGVVARFKEIVKQDAAPFVIKINTTQLVVFDDQWVTVPVVKSFQLTSLIQTLNTIYTDETGKKCPWEEFTPHISILRSPVKLSANTVCDISQVQVSLRHNVLVTEINLQIGCKCYTFKLG